MIKLIETVLDIIYPKRCLWCGEILDFGRSEDFCLSCRNKFEGLNLLEYKDENGFSLFNYDGEIRTKILSLKYDGKRDIGKAFGCLMYKAFIKNGFDMDFDEILPVAISRKRLKERGYNQTEIMAEELSRLSGIPVGKGLVRVKETKPQNKLNIEERKINVKNAFKTDRSFEGKKILLIDDIYTTGSTAAACAEALYTAGARSVKFCTAAKTYLRNQ